MSSYNEPKIKTYKAGADLSAKQYHFVKVGTADDEVVAAGANVKTVGVLMNAPASGERAEVAIMGGGALLKLDEAVSPLDLLTPTASNQGEQCDAADEWCGAIADETGADGDIIAVNVVGFYSSKSDA